ncbi:hypothetical protein AAGF08_02835 [Algoriphagus sp. SE2]|uniref:hypothetical protein n=1 Tax=Algoriphagus sp. SE2 TaxID=3141536 RepID=UPI0031CD5B2C
MKSISYFVFTVLIITLLACSSSEKDKERENTNSAIENKVTDFSGDYVTEGYYKREEGYDWTVVRIFKNEQGELVSEISSRSDLKRPTCSWKTNLSIENERTLSTSFMDKIIHFELEEDSLFIKGENTEAGEILYFFCSGGGSLENSYVKLNEPLDTTQISNFTFEQKHELQGVSFDIKATEQNPYTTLSIETDGLEVDTDPIFHKIDGGYIESEIEDLNSDGWPEILIFFNSYGLEMKASLIGYSVNNGKSMSRISMPEMSAEASVGFQGQDDFAIVETTLIQRFPVFKLEDGNWVPSGKTRQIQYKLRNGETSREFYEADIIEY